MNASDMKDITKKRAPSPSGKRKKGLDPAMSEGSVAVQTDGLEAGLRVQSNVETQSPPSKADLSEEQSADANGQIDVLLDDNALFSDAGGAGGDGSPVVDDILVADAAPSAGGSGAGAGAGAVGSSAAAAAAMSPIAIAAGAIAAAAVAAGGSSSDASGSGGSGSGGSGSGGGGATQAGVVSGGIVAGPVLAGNDLLVEIYEADGITKVGEGTVNSDGSYSVDIQSDYTGAVIARVSSTGNSPDYVDEASLNPINLAGVIMAVGVLTADGLTLYITPLSTIAAGVMGVGPSGAPTVDLSDPAVVEAANDKVARIFGFASADDMLAPVGGIKPVVNDDGSPNTSADAFGKVLALLSSLEEAFGATALDLLVEDLQAGESLSAQAKFVMTVAARDPELLSLGIDIGSELDGELALSKEELQECEDFRTNGGGRIQISAEDMAAALSELTGVAVDADFLEDILALLDDPNADFDNISDDVEGAMVPKILGYTEGELGGGLATTWDAANGLSYFIEGSADDLLTANYPMIGYTSSGSTASSSTTLDVLGVEIDGGGVGAAYATAWSFVVDDNDPETIDEKGLLIRTLGVQVGTAQAQAAEAVLAAAATTDGSGSEAKLGIFDAHVSAYATMASSGNAAANAGLFSLAGTGGSALLEISSLSVIAEGEAGYAALNLTPDWFRSLPPTNIGIAAVASGDGAASKISIIGDVSVQSNGTNTSVTEVNGLAAATLSDDGVTSAGVHSRVSLGGSFVASAGSESNAPVAASANLKYLVASIGFPFSGDGPTDSSATVDKLDEVQVKAFGESFAAAVIGSSVKPSSFSPTFSDTVEDDDGGILAWAGGSGSTAKVELGQVFVDAKSNGDAYGAIEGIRAYADDLATARVLINDGVQLTADGARAGVYLDGVSAVAATTTGDAYAGVGGGEALAYIGSDLIVSAVATESEAVAVFDGLYAQALGDLATASVNVVGSIDVMANAPTFAAAGLNYLKIEATAAAGSLRVDGSVTVAAEALGQDGVAYVGSLYFSGSPSSSYNSSYSVASSSSSANFPSLSSGAEIRASGYGGTAVNLHIGGDVTLQAIASMSAQVSGAGVAAQAYGGGGSEVSISIDGDMRFEASASQSAEVRGGGLSAGAYAHGDIVSVDLAGDLSVVASEGGDVQARLSSISVSSAVSGSPVFSDSEDNDVPNAFVSIGGDVLVSATGSAIQSQAVALIEEIYIYSNGGDSTLVVDGALQASSSGSSLARAGSYSGFYSAAANNGSAILEVNGAVEFSAEASGTDGTAIIGNVTSSSTGYVAFGVNVYQNGIATIDIGGDINLYAIAAYADVDLYGLSADVYGNEGTALLSVAGGLALSAVSNADGSAEGIKSGADAILGSLQANTYDSVGSTAAIVISQGVQISATSTSGFSHAELSKVGVSGDGALVDLNGLSMAAQGAAGADLSGLVIAGKGGVMDVGDLSLSSESEAGNASLNFAALALGGAEVSLGDVSITVAGTAPSEQVWQSNAMLVMGAQVSDYFSMQYGDGGGTINVGSLSLHVDHAYAKVWIGDVVRNNDPAVATFSGTGDVSIGIHNAAFGVIDRSELVGSLEMFVAMEDIDDYESLQNFDDFDYMLVKDFDSTTDKLFFSEGNNILVSQDPMGDLIVDESTAPALVVAAFIDLGQGDERSLIAAFNEVLNGTTNIAYARLTGTATLNGETIDGNSSDVYAVAYDADGIGITSLLLVQGAFSESNLLPGLPAYG